MNKFLKLISVVFLLSIFQVKGEDFIFFSPQMLNTQLKSYNDEEIKAIEKDLKVVRDICLTKDDKTHVGDKPLYLATAGGPGARKTTILERFLKSKYPSSNIVYLDPDPRTLKYMVHTYYQSLSALNIAEQQNYSTVIKNAYNKWRYASTYIASTLLEEAFSNKRDIAFGTTSTGEHIPKFLDKVKNAGYEIVLLLCSAEDNFKKQAIQYRNEEQRFYQSSPEDIVNKGKFFPQRMRAYFTYADTLYLFWNDDLFSREKLAAILNKGNLQVVDNEALTHFINKFEADRDSLMKEGKNIPSWSELLSLYQSRFNG